MVCLYPLGVTYQVHLAEKWSMCSQTHGHFQGWSGAMGGTDYLTLRTCLHRILNVLVHPTLSVASIM